MKIGIASGKGGTGKTTVATNLAYVAACNGRTVGYVDCDVEEPNGHIFLKPQLDHSQRAGKLVPHVDPERCTLCGKCGEICSYNAIVRAGQQVLVFADLCHACGGCARVCGPGAITERLVEIGTIETGQADSIRFAHGILDVGQAMSPPLIRDVLATQTDADVIFVDAPPGTSCPVVETVRHCDRLLLVTEPTPFGLHDLKLAVETVRILGLPFAVVINRADVGDHEVRAYCNEEGIATLAEIPDDRRIAESYSSGRLICEALPKYREAFAELLDKVINDEGIGSH